jgi:hypothetical protein
MVHQKVLITIINRRPEAVFQDTDVFNHPKIVPICTLFGIQKEEKSFYPNC